MRNDDDQPPAAAGPGPAAPVSAAVSTPDRPRTGGRGARRLWAALGIAAALTAGGLVVVRASAGRVIDDGLSRARADLAAQGGAATLTVDGGWAAGFPFTVRRRLTNVEIVAPHGRATAESGEIVYSLLRPDVAAATFRRVTAETPDGGRATADAAELIVDLTQRPLNGGGALPRAAALRLDGATLDAWRADRATIDLRFPDSPPVDHTQPGLTISVAATGAAPPVDWAALVGSTDAKGEIAFVAAVNGPPPALRGQALEAWRADGGTVELTAARAVFPPMKADGDATLALDRDLQIIGAGSLRLTGVDAALAHAAETVQRQGGPFKPKDVKQIRQIAALLTQPDPNGGPPRLTLPFNAQNGRLFLGPLQVAKLPPSPWRSTP